MTQTMSIQSHPDAGLCKVLTTTYNSGAQSKRYLDAQGMPFDIVWVKPLLTLTTTEKLNKLKAALR